MSTLLRWCSAVVVFGLVLAGAARAEIEVQTGRVVGERFGDDPVVFTADPFHKFDPMGGMRQLDRVLVDAGIDWECVIQLANPFPEQQDVRYTALDPTAGLSTNSSLEFLLFVPGNPSGVLSAPPLQTVQRLLTYREPPFPYYELEPLDPLFLSMVGPGPLVFEDFSFGADFDTFRLINGIPQGGPSGFSVFRERWEIEFVFTYEYTVVPAPSVITAVLGGAWVTQRRRRPER